MKRDAPQISTLPDGRKCKVRPSASSATLAEPTSAPSQSPGGDAGAPAPSPSAAAEAASAAPEPASSESSEPAAPSSSTEQQQPQEESATASEAPVETAPAAPAKQHTWGGAATASGAWKNTGSKAGIAWPNGDYWQPDQPQYISNYIGSKMSWYYTWSSYRVQSGDEQGLEFVPMLWGHNKVQEWRENRDKNWDGAHVANALFYNEPNQHDQSAIDAYSWDATNDWTNEYLPLRSRGIKLGGAAPTSAPDGVEWVKNFKNACVNTYHNADWDCDADFFPVHYYDVDVEHFKQYLINFHDQVGKPLWVTEYACQNFNGGAQCDDGNIWYMHNQMSEWMEQQDWIHRYAPFGVMQNMQNVNPNNALMASWGGITPLGNAYISGFDS